MKSSIQESLDIFMRSYTDLPKIIVVYWPTACGKTALSLEIAEYIESEIISTDSRQIYRYMDIGTGKIQKNEMRWIPHHMIDIIDPSEIFSVVEFVNKALPIIENIQKKWKIPILCGGTGLYIDGILYEMGYPDVVPDWEYRNTLEDIRLREWNQVLWNMLEKIDPEYAKELEVGNYRYIMRWLEVIKQSGQSKLKSKWKKIPRFSPLFVTPYIDTERSELYKKIDTRVLEMYNNWLVEETEYNTRRFSSHCPGLMTIGYREVVDALEWNMTLESAIQLIQQRSRNYAKRQITWNKKYELNTIR